MAWTLWIISVVWLTVIVEKTKTQETVLGYIFRPQSGPEFPLNFTRSTLMDFKNCICKREIGICDLYFQPNGIVTRIENATLGHESTTSTNATSIYICGRALDDNEIRCEWTELMCPAFINNCVSVEVIGDQTQCERGQAVFGWHTTVSLVNNTFYHNDKVLQVMFERCDGCPPFPAVDGGDDGDGDDEGGDDDDDDDDDDDPTIIIVVIVPSIVVAVIVFLICIFVWRRRKQPRKDKPQPSSIQSGPPQSGTNLASDQQDVEENRGDVYDGYDAPQAGHDYEDAKTTDYESTTGLHSSQRASDYITPVHVTYSENSTVSGPYTAPSDGSYSEYDTVTGGYVNENAVEFGRHHNESILNAQYSTID